MKVAYVDTSALVAVAFDEPASLTVANRLKGFSRLLSSNLLEAELRSVCTREKIEFQSQLVSGIEWVLPDRALSSEFRMVLDTGYTRGADLMHLATALYAGNEPSFLTFVTLDMHQKAIADALGFRI